MAGETDTDVGDDIEARARVQGWRPKDEFRGKPEDWVDASEFLERGQRIQPILHERFRALEERYGAAQAELGGARQEITSLRSELGEVKEVLTDFREFAKRGEDRAYERAKRELEARRDVAVAHADTDAFRQAQAELDELAKTQVKVETKPAPATTETQRSGKTEQPGQVQQHPDLVAWISENPWFNTDRMLNGVASAIDADLMTAKPGLGVKDRLVAVKAEVQRRFPEKFENPLREGPNSVAQPAGQNFRRAKGKTYDDLPPEAKKQCDRYMRTMKGFTKDDYVKTYFAGEE